MNELIQVVSEIALLLHPDRIIAISDRLQTLRSLDDVTSLNSIFRSNINNQLLDKLRVAIHNTPGITPRELAAAFLGASFSTRMTSLRNGNVELVWTGPSTGFVPIRHTEQVLCEVIETAQSKLSIVSYVAYEVDSIISALIAAENRQVQINILLESSVENGGRVNVDSVHLIKSFLPSVNVYVWNENASGLRGGSVHAKCAVADGMHAFITSANLSIAAMERNMELGVLIKGGSLPERLHRHLEALISIGLVQKI